MLPRFSQNVALQGAFKTLAQINEEPKIKDFDAWCILEKNSNFWSIDFLHLFAKRKSVKKMIHQKKNRGHRTSKIVKSRQSCNNDYLARASMYDRHTV